MFYLGEEYEGVYFTKREAECLIHMLEGNTIVATAKLLALSPRTVEFYVKNMKMKVSAATKADLLKKISKTNFMKNYRFKMLATAAVPTMEAEGA